MPKNSELPEVTQPSGGFFATINNFEIASYRVSISNLGKALDVDLIPFNAQKSLKQQIDGKLNFYDLMR